MHLLRPDVVDIDNEDRRYNEWLQPSDMHSLHVFAQLTVSVKEELELLKVGFLVRTRGTHFYLQAGAQALISTLVNMYAPNIIREVKK